MVSDFLASAGFLAMLGYHPDESNEITWTPFFRLLSRVNWVKAEYAHGIPSVCLEDFDDEVVDEDVSLVYDEVVADDALVESLNLTWRHGSTGNVPVIALRDRAGIGNLLSGLLSTKGFTTFELQGQVSISLMRGSGIATTGMQREVKETHLFNTL